VSLDEVHGTWKCIFGIYVNHYLVIENENGINDFINGLKTYKFGLKIADDLKVYLSCRILTDYERKAKFVIKSHLIKNLREKFENEVNNLSDYGMPGTPRFEILDRWKKLRKLSTIYNQNIVLAWVCLST
jgi:hypothetical protein